MAIVFHTKDEIIPVSSLSERWSIDDIGLIRTIVYEKFNIFFATDIRETETITYFVGHCFTYEKDYDSIGRAAQELFSGVLGAGPEAEEGEAFLLKKDVLEYEKANPYLLSKPIAPGTWQEHMQVFKDALPVPALNGGHSEQHAQGQGERIAELERENQRLKDELKRKPTLFGNDMAEGLARGVVESQAKLEKQMLASMPRYGLLNNVEAERDRAMKRVAELERQLAEGDSIRGQVEHGTRSEEVEQQLAAAQGEIARLKEQLAGHSAQAQGVDASQAEALKLEREAHARTREELAAAQGRLTELERQLAGVQEELDATKAKLKEALEEHGVCSYVIRERQAGTREEDIAAGLLKRGLNGSQAGAWIYSQEWGSKDARKKSFQRLTGTA